MQNFFTTIFGISLILMVVHDVYATILHGRGRTGPVSEALNHTVWYVARLIALRLPRSRRHRFLNLFGPALLPALVVIYILLLAVGYALIYYPRMPGSFTVDPQATNAQWIESIYFSGTTLTTVGYGDIAPRTMVMRFVALVESASGFALISLAVTYLLTVYSSLQRKRAVALSLYHQSEEGADVARFITHHFVQNRFVGLELTLQLAARDLNEMLEAHFEHPVIHYFHPIEVYRNMPRVLFILLETCAIVRSCLDENEYAETRDHPEVRTLESTAVYVLNRLVESLGLKKEAETVSSSSTKEDTARWRRRFRQTMERLQEAGITTRRDRTLAWDTYRTQREKWEAPLYSFSIYLGYDWDEVTGDRDLHYAADEEMEEPEEVVSGKR